MPHPFSSAWGNDVSFKNVWKRTFLWKYSTIYERCTETSFDICIWYYWHQFSKMFVFFKKTKYCVFCDMYRYTLCHQCQLYFCSMAKKSLKTKKRVCCIGFSILCIRTTFFISTFFSICYRKIFPNKMDQVEVMIVSWTENIDHESVVTLWTLFTLTSRGQSNTTNQTRWESTCTCVVCSPLII